MMEPPPAVNRHVPVVLEERDEARNTIMSATSSGCVCVQEREEEREREKREREANKMFHY